MRLKELKEAHPKAEVELWAEDEARLGLKPVLRRLWAPMGKRPVARFKRGYKWTYLCGTVTVNAVAIGWERLLCEPVAVMRTVGPNGPTHRYLGP